LCSSETQRRFVLFSFQGSIETRLSNRNTTPEDCQKIFPPSYGQDSFIVSDTYYYNYILSRCQSLFHYFLPGQGACRPRPHVYYIIGSKCFQYNFFLIFCGLCTSRPQKNRPPSLSARAERRGTGLIGPRPAVTGDLCLEKKFASCPLFFGKKK